MEIQLISSEKFYITQQEVSLYKRYLGTYNSISVESVCCPSFENDGVEDILYLRGNSEHRDCDDVRVPRDKMKQVLTALSMCCIEHGVTLTIKL